RTAFVNFWNLEDTLTADASRTGAASIYGFSMQLPLETIPWLRNSWLSIFRLHSVPLRATKNLNSRVGMHVAMWTSQRIDGPFRCRKETWFRRPWQYAMQAPDCWSRPV